MVFQQLKNKINIRPLRFIYIFYWFLLTYIIAALVFWFFSLNKQNAELAYYKQYLLDTTHNSYIQNVREIKNIKARKTTQYIGEGITFLLLIMAGAVFVFRLVRRQLLQSQQQNHFMMAITHELKTPIAVTKLNLETMQKRKLDNEQQQKLISSTIQEANRLNAMCNNMLLVSQMDSGGYIFTDETIDLTTISKECAEDFKIRFPQRELVADIENNLWVNGDRLLLQLTINNLLDNAFKYSKKEDVISLQLFKESRTIKLQVKDQGIGIPALEKDKVFEKYFRGAKMQTKGTGLGLYLTRQIVKQHQGAISVFDNQPRGSIFEIRLKSR